ncbi:MAG: hypothetical protein GF353_00625 [Candidatus Lokiarchaeota archaeon]|nr:hypothetical protein [Candidatus Lokiarchaeota archaeon]
MKFGHGNPLGSSLEQRERTRCKNFDQIILPFVAFQQCILADDLPHGAIISEPPGIWRCVIWYTK